MEKVLDVRLVFAETFQEAALLHTVMHFHLILFNLFSDDQVDYLDLFLNFKVMELLRVKFMVADSLVKKLLEIFAEMEMRHVL